MWNSNDQHFIALHVQPPHAFVVTPNIKVPDLETLKQVAKQYSVTIKHTEISVGKYCSCQHLH